MDLTGKYIESTYQKVLHIHSGSYVYDGTGSFVSPKISGSLSVYGDMFVIGENVYIEANTYITGSVSISGSLDMTGNEINDVQAVEFDLSPTDSASLEGRVYWNDDYGTLNIGMGGGVVNQQVGLEDLVRTVNKTGDTILNGSVVYVTGVQGQRLTIATASRDNADSLFILGMTTEDIPDNQSGWVTQRGGVNEVNTSNFNEGDKIYLGLSGSIQNTHPLSPFDGVVILGRIERSHLTSGTIHLDTPQLFTLGNDFNGTLRTSVINKNTGSSAAVGFTAVIDDNRFVTFGLAGQNNAVFTDSVAVMYTPGYGNFLQAVDGAKDFVWLTDPTDSHNNSALNNEVMRLTSTGNLIVSSGSIEGLLNTPSESVSPNISSSTTFYLDEVSDTLMVSVRYSNGTYKSGSVELF